MNNKDLFVAKKGIKGGVSKTTKEGYVRLFFGEGEFERNKEYLEIDMFQGSGINYQKRKEPAIKIKFETGETWKGSLNDLKEMLIKKVNE